MSWTLNNRKVKRYKVEVSSWEKAGIIEERFFDAKDLEKVVTELKEKYDRYGPTIWMNYYEVVDLDYED